MYHPRDRFFWVVFNLVWEGWEQVDCPLCFFPSAFIPVWGNWWQNWTMHYPQSSVCPTEPYCPQSRNMKWRAISLLWVVTLRGWWLSLSTAVAICQGYESCGGIQRPEPSGWKPFGKRRGSSLRGCWKDQNIKIRARRSCAGFSWL